MRLTMSALARAVTLSLILAAVGVHANLMGVDLGLGYVKVAVARPGKGLELVTNEQAKRKTPAAVGFTTEGERLFGDAAVAYAAKAPGRVVLDGRMLVGLCSIQSEGPFCEREQINLDGVGAFSGEEIVAMLLGMARRQASAALNGAPIKDVAITVPAWFDERQRMAVADAARVIGLNCLGVVNANTAAAIKYALDGKAKPSEQDIADAKSADKKKKTPKTLTQTVMFYDIGAGSTSTTIAEISSDVKTGVANSIKVLAHAHDLSLGGRRLDTVIVDRLADAFDKQRGPSATPSRDLPRVMMRLRKEGQRVREVLSANSETAVSVASLHDDLDFRTTISRADFETDASPMLNLVSGPAKQALSDAGIKAFELDAVVPFGGASRTPKLQELLCSALGRESLNKSINSDEAAVMGSVFFAASHSSTFRVRKLGLDDIYGRSVSAEIERSNEAAGGMFSGKKAKKAAQKVEIFTAGAARMPSKKTVSLNRDGDFGLKVFLGLDKSGSRRFPQRTLYADIKVSGVAKVLKKLRDPSKAKGLTPRVALTFHIDSSGLIRIGTAESSVDEVVTTEREVEVKDDNDKTKTNKNDTKDETKEDSKKDTEKDSMSDAREEGKEGGSTANPSSGKDGDDAVNTTTDEKAGDDKKDDEKTKDKKKKKTRMEKSTQTIVHRQTLTIEYLENAESLMGMQLSGDQLKSSQKVLSNLEAADIERAERADALNSLEGFILDARSIVRSADEDDDLHKVTTEEAREALVVAFDAAEDWMYTEEAKQTANLRKKHFELQKMYTPMTDRARELKTRPAALKSLVETTDLALERVAVLRKLHEERKSGKVEEFDKFRGFCDAIKTWVAEMEAAQAAKALTEEPAVSLKQINGKGEELKAQVERVARLELPRAPVAPAEKAEKASSGTGEGAPTSSSGENATADAGAATGAAEDDTGPAPVKPDADAAAADAASVSGVKDEL